MRKRNVGLHLHLLTWFTGRQTVAAFFASQPFVGPGRLRLVPVMTNGQPSFASYVREPDGTCRAHAVTVPAVTTVGIARIVTFRDPALFKLFGLPQEYRAS